MSVSLYNADLKNNRIFSLVSDDFGRLQIIVLVIHVHVQFMCTCNYRKWSWEHVQKKFYLKQWYVAVKDSPLLSTNFTEYTYSLVTMGGDIGLDDDTPPLLTGNICLIGVDCSSTGNAGNTGLSITTSVADNGWDWTGVTSIMVTLLLDLNRNR